MNPLIISMEVNGVMQRVGTITGNDPSDSCFRYDEEYCEHGGEAISVSLPVQKDVFSVKQTAAFFEGLLPEGFTRRSVAQWMQVDEEDYLSILHGLGRECLGAICVHEQGEELHAAYEKVTDAMLREFAAEGAVKSAQMVTNSHLSLTGASGKAGLYHETNHDEWYLPHGTAPSTHIVKQSHVRLESIVVNEKLSLLTAMRCGLSVPESRIINTGQGGERDILFATRRYDRVFDQDSKMIDGLVCPYRLHQEDFAQAMGVPSAKKYESEKEVSQVTGKRQELRRSENRTNGKVHSNGKDSIDGKGYLQGMFDVLRRYSSDPVSDSIRLWDLIVFNVLIGNTDAHIKNFSLLYGKNMRNIRLAPAYDIVSTAVYEQSTRNMAFRIGGVQSLDDISRDSFRQSAVEAGIGEKMALRRLDAMTAHFPDALRESAEELVRDGYPKAAKISDRILLTGGYRNLQKKSTRRSQL